MQANKTVTINGRIYDAVTGLPVEKPKAVASKPSVSSDKRAQQVAAATVHTSTQRSKTLHRRAIKKPAVVKRPEPGRHMDISRSSKIARFAPHPAASVRKEVSTRDIAATPHPAASRALARTSAKHSKPVAQTPKQVKDAAIASALAKPTAKPPKKKRFALRWSRRFTIITAVFAVLILGAYLTYANIPSLSVGFASAQAGIQATYPEYRPDGYSLHQPVTFSDGKVTLEFQSNSGNGGYTIVQSSSSWDSSAVLDNVVRKAVGDDYTTTQERGLTLYSYDNSSSVAWVNGGILYTITSTAPLSGEQIRRIATSL